VGKLSHTKGDFRIKYWLSHTHRQNLKTQNTIPTTLHCMVSCAPSWLCGFLGAHCHSSQEMTLWHAAILGKDWHSYLGGMASAECVMHSHHPQVKNSSTNSWVWWHMPVIHATVGSLKQEDFKSRTVRTMADCEASSPKVSDQWHYDYSLELASVGIFIPLNRQTLEIRKWLIIQLFFQ
jgi:hypothetical protein